MLDRQAELLIQAAAELGLPRVETIDPVTARELYDTRTDAITSTEIASVEDKMIPGPGGDLPIRIYRDRPADETLPIIMFFHGGGWVFGTIGTHDGVCRLLAQRSGAMVISVEYRLAPEHPFPEPVDDCEAATQWVADNAAELGGDASRLAVAGDSAGGNLAAVVAQTCRNNGGPKLAAQVLVYPATDLGLTDSESYIANADGYLLTQASMVWFSGKYVTDDAQLNDPRCSPIKGDLTGLPAAFVLTAGYDPLRDDGRAYSEALKAAGVDVVEVEYPGQVHSFFTQIGVMDAATDAVDQIAAFLKPRL